MTRRSFPRATDAFRLYGLVPSAALALLLLLPAPGRADRPVITLEGAKVQAYPVALAPPRPNGAAER